MTGDSSQRLPFGAAFKAGLLQDGGNESVRRNRGLPAAVKLRGGYVASSLDQRDLASLVGGMAVDASRERDEPVLPVSDSFVGAIGQLRDDTDFDSTASEEGRFDRAARAVGETLVSPAGAGFSAALGIDCGLDAPANLKKRREPRRADMLDDSVREAEVVRGCAAPATLHDLARALDRHPEGQAVLEQLRDICGSVPGNVTLLQELSNYVNRPPWEQPRQLLGGGAVVGTGNVTGPAVSTDNAIARYDGTTGKVIQNSGVWLNDTGQLQAHHASPIPTYSFQSPHDMSGMAWDADVGQGPALKDTNGDTQLRITTAGVEIDNDLTVGDLTANNLALANPLPITQGGTGADNATSARTNLGAGDASGPSSSTDHALAVYDGTTGKLLKNSSILMDHPPFSNPTIRPIDVGSGNGVPLQLRAGNTSDVGIGAVGGDVVIDAGLASASGNVAAVRINPNHAGSGSCVIRGGFALTDDDVQISEGGTGASTADGAQVNLVNGATSRTPTLSTVVPGYNFSGATTSGGTLTAQQILDLINSLTAGTPILTSPLGGYLASAAAARRFTPNQILDLLTALTAKTSLADADQLMLADSAASNVAKKITVTNLKVALGVGNAPVYGFNTSDQGNSSSTYTNTTGIVVSVGSSTRYAFEAVIPIQSSTSNGIKVRLSGGTATITNMKIEARYTTTTGTAAENTTVLKSTALNTDLSSPSSTFNGWLVLKGYILINQSGTVQMQHAITGGLGTATVQNGAWMRLTPLT